MGYNSTYTVEDLIGTLSEMDPQAPVMVAVQPIWPFEHTITGGSNRLQRYSIPCIQTTWIFTSGG